MKILAFDPGGTTGICGWHDGVGVTMQDQVSEANHHSIILQLLKLVEPNVIVYETFNYIPNLPDADLIAREYIGILKLWEQHNEDSVLLIPQSPSYGKGFWSDEKLKKARLYKPGLPHAMDATRHLLAYTSFSKKDQMYLQMLR